MKDSKNYSVGEIAKLCGISARQLRYYDQIGIIRPAYRNPDNGYRYYDEDQLELFFLLAELRNIGISNDSVQRMFANRDVEQLIQELQINLAMVESEIQALLSRYRNIVNALVTNTKAFAYLNGQAAIESPDYMQYWVSISRIPETKILYMTFEDDAEFGDRNEYVRRSAALTKLADGMGLKLADTKLYIRNHVDISQLYDGTCAEKGCYEFAREIMTKNVPEDPGCIRTYGGFNAVCTINVGWGTSINDAYRILGRWASDHKTALADTAIEERMIDAFTVTDPERYVTRLMIPLAGSFD